MFIVQIHHQINHNINSFFIKSKLDSALNVDPTCNIFSINAKQKVKECTINLNCQSFFFSLNVSHLLLRFINMVFIKRNSNNCMVCKIN